MSAAAGHNNVEMMKLFIYHDHDPRFHDNLCINKAIEMNKIEMVKFLLKQGCFPNSAKVFHSSNLEIIELLLQNNIPIKFAFEYISPKMKIKVAELMLKYYDLNECVKQCPNPAFNGLQKYPFYYATETCQYLISDNPPEYFKHLQDDIYYCGNPEIEELRKYYYSCYPSQKSANN